MTAVRVAIVKSFSHCVSSDESPRHQKYPQGLDWWCFYNKATANGQDPLSHKDHTGTPLSQNGTRTVKPTYDRMSDPSLLQRTEHERTQNTNECLNGIGPKVVHVGADTVNAVEASSVQF